MPALTPSARAAAAVTLGAVAAYYYFQCHYRPRRRAAAAARRFHRDGIAVVRGFASASECREMLASMDTLVEAWDPAETTSVFRTDASQSVAQGKDDYFITSADAVRFFLEPGAMDEVSGALLVPKQEANPNANPGPNPDPNPDPDPDPDPDPNPAARSGAGGAQQGGPRTARLRARLRALRPVAQGVG
jgi:hypothetical protein